MAFKWRSFIANENKNEKDKRRLFEYLGLTSE